jgi:phospho-N-acetylmuramoyl-pentapeptide-transferase
VIRLLIAGAVALLVSLVGTRYLVRLLTARRIGQPIRAEGPEGHQAKAGTPTMGGLAIVVGAVAGYVISNLYRGIYTRTGLAVMATIVGAGAVGLLDDWIKVTRARNLGLTTRTKLIGQLVVAMFFVVAAIKYFGNSTTLSFTRWSNPGWDVGPYAWALLAILWILGSTNAVNLTDGLDGLAAGSSVLGFAAYTIIAFWQFRHYDIYLEAHALDLAVVAAAMAGGCLGFLWWNAPPAAIFMGDAGSLALGAAFATLALTTDTMLLLPLLGGLFVMETASVIIQVASFRLRRKRVFRMAPLHHHFELGGWPETTVIIRFWVIAGLCTAVALGIYYADFLSTGAAD